MRVRCALLSLIILSASITVFAQAGPNGPHRYDPATEATITGTVEDVLHPAGYNGMAGTHVNLKTQDGVVQVHLGPEAYIAKQNFSIEKGDTLSVTGSKQVMGGQTVLLAREVKKGDAVLTLRDANGIPKWSRRNTGANQ
jgi:hypothetical protein